MKAWEYLKGCENDFAGHNAAHLVVKSGRTGMIHYLSHYYAGRISTIEAAGDTVIAIRVPVDDEQDLNECIGQHNWREKVGELYMDGEPHTAHLDGTNCRCKPSDMTIQGIPINEISGTETVTYNKYLREIKTGVWVDIYDVLMAWGVTNPALQHLIKKALQAGDRGHKSREQDLQDIIDSAIRAKELEVK